MMMTMTMMLVMMMVVMQAKPLCQPAIDSNCLRKMMDQKSAWATNYSKWEADYRVSIIIFIFIVLIVILIICIRRQATRAAQRRSESTVLAGLEGWS